MQKEGDVWRLDRGANYCEGETSFAVWAPAASAVSVVLGEDGDGQTLPLELGSAGVFAGRWDHIPRGERYRYLLDGKKLRPDPVSRFQPRGVHGPSAVIDPAQFDWSDFGWRGVETKDFVIYELHIGTFTEQGTFDGAVKRLRYLEDLGVTAIEIMPVAQFPGARNWGYDGVLPYAVQNSYGGPLGLKRLVDAAHQLGIAVVLDVVYNHLGPEGNYLADFGPYFTDRYRTPWGKAINFDGPDSDPVRQYFVDNALYWISEYHIDALRLDAVHAIYDFGARHILQEIAEAVQRHGGEAGRTLSVIAESDLNDPRLVRHPNCGGYGLDAQWSDDFHHAVHTYLSGERYGYYEDFGSLQHVAGALQRTFCYDGRYSNFRRRTHGAPADDVPADRFVVCLQNHDQVGNRAAGERLGALVTAGQYRLAAALLLVNSGIPLLFMGQEYGEQRPFLYFVSHEDERLLELVRRGRNDEFAAFHEGKAVPDPASPETFERSKLDEHALAGDDAGRLYRLHRALIALRRSVPALASGRRPSAVRLSEDEQWLTYRIEDDTSALLLLFNFASAPRQITAHAEKQPRLLLYTASPAFAADGAELLAVYDAEQQEVSCPLAPHSAAVLLLGGEEAQA